MMQSVRERIPEFAVMKTLGFSDKVIVGIVFTEALIIVAAGAALGLLGAINVVPLLTTQFGSGNLSLNILLVGAASAVFLTAISVFLLALRAKRLSIIDALAGR